MDAAKKMKIAIFSDVYLPTFPFLELPLYHELKARGYDISYVLLKDDIRLTTPYLFAEFSKLNLKTIGGSGGITSIVGKGDLFISRFDYKRAASKIAGVAKGAGAIVLMLDPSGVDIGFRRCIAHYLTSKSIGMEKMVAKKFPGIYKHVFTTGTIHYDAAAITQVNKEDFMRSYGFDHKKKLALLTPANPGEAHMVGLKDDYRKIVEIISKQCPGYELAIKAHPMDYLAHTPTQPGVVHKNEHYKGNYSWEEWGGGTKVIKAEEGYKALKACDVVVNIRSSLAMETALFNKPLINVNRHKYVTNWPFMDGVMKDIKIEDLANTLNKNQYSVDVGKCSIYVKEQCYSADGKAYVRTADAVDNILKKV